MRVYAWDEQDRLIEVRDLQTDELLLQNRYDGLSRRRERVQLEDGVLVTNRYVYDGWLVVAVLDGENEVLEQYVHGMDLSGSREGAGGIGGILAVAQSGMTNYFHYDGNGNVASVTDSAGAIISRLEYDPFGRVLIADGDYSPRYQFSSKEYDATVGLNYYGYRFYNPELGRWINRDPLGDEAFRLSASGHTMGWLDDLSDKKWLIYPLYSFVRNSPIGHWDYLGLIRDWLPDWAEQGRCCNKSSGDEWALVAEGDDCGKWVKLAPGECAGGFSGNKDCEGMSCGGGFYVVKPYDLTGSCKTPGCDKWPYTNRRWTPDPNERDDKSESPTVRGACADQGDTPPGYEYGPRP